jgi:hypothetical protein
MIAELRIAAGELIGRMGGTGSLPVPPGYQPGGMTAVQSGPEWPVSLDWARFSFRSAGCRPEQAGSLFHPVRDDVATTIPNQK